MLLAEPQRRLHGRERENHRLAALRMAGERRNAFVCTRLGTLLEHEFQKPALLGRQIGDAPRPVVHHPSVESWETDRPCACSNSASIWLMSVSASALAWVTASASPATVGASNRARGVSSTPK